MGVRVAEPHDVPAALAVCLAAQTARRGAAPPVAATAALARRLRAAAYRGRMLLATDDGARPYGVAAVDDADDSGGGGAPGAGHLVVVMVAPDRQGRGVGGRLLDAVVAAAPGWGYRGLTVWADAADPRAARLYEGHGFAGTDVRRTDPAAGLLRRYRWDASEPSATRPRLPARAAGPVAPDGRPGGPGTAGPVAPDGRLGAPG